MLIWLLVIAGVVILDQLSKILMMNLLPNRGDTIPVINDFFHFTHVRNTGAAFGMLGEENQRWIFIIISTIGIIALLVYLWKFRPESKWACAALSMIIGGGIGNMIDRCFRAGEVDGEIRHYVFDFIDFRGIWSYVFNVADAFVCVGAGILMVWCIWAFIDETKKEKAKKALKATAVDEDKDIDTEDEPEESSDNTDENTENTDNAEN